MSKKEKIVVSDEEARKVVSSLVFKVLAENLCVREALMLFPPDVEDLSIQCAWHALIHLESDEEIRKKDTEYIKEQDHYLEVIAFTLQKGEPLPLNIIEDYRKYYELAPMPKSNSLKGILKRLFRFIN